MVAQAQYVLDGGVDLGAALVLVLHALAASRQHLERVRADVLRGADSYVIAQGLYVQLLM